VAASEVEEEEEEEEEEMRLRHTAKDPDMFERWVQISQNLKKNGPVGSLTSTCTLPKKKLGTLNSWHKSRDVAD